MTEDLYEDLPEPPSELTAVAEKDESKTEPAKETPSETTDPEKTPSEVAKAEDAPSDEAKEEKTSAEDQEEDVVTELPKKSTEKVCCYYLHDVCECVVRWDRYFFF